MTLTLEEIDSVLVRANPIDESIPAATLREWRSELVRTSVFVSYAIGVLSLDAEVLNHCLAAPDEDVLQSVIDNLPDLLAAGWVGGGWSLSPDASASVAAAEVAADGSAGLLGLHTEMVLCDLSEPRVVHDLLLRVEQDRQALTERREQLEERIRRIQEVLLQHYATGDVSTEDWLA